MPIDYKNLINVGGEIRTKEGKKFKDHAELAGFLGIKPHDIDWAQISKSADYEGLTNVGGEIRTTGGRAFKSSAELAGFLGIKPNEEIDWTKIAPQTPQNAPQAPISPLGEVVSQQAQIEDPRKAILDQLSKTFQQAISGMGAVDYGARFKELKEEAGLGKISERIGTLDMEIGKTEDFLKKLEDDIRERVSGELVTESGARRKEAVERAPLIEQLGELERSRGIEAGMFERGERGIEAQMGFERAGREDVLSQLNLATNIARAQADLGAQGIETQVIDKGTSRVLVNKATGEVIQEYDITKAPEEISELDKVRIKKIEAETARIYQQANDNPSTQLAKNYFSKTQIADAAKRAGMTVSEFGNLSVDKANQFIQGASMINGQARTISDMDIKSTIANMKTEKLSREEAARAVLDDVNLLPADKMEALKIIEEEYKAGFWSKAFGFGK